MKKKASLLFILRILKTALGIATLSISARYFGVTIERDEWLLSMGVILVLDNAIWGPINETFRAKFIFLQHEIGNTESLAKARSMFSFINFVTVILVGLILLFPGVLAKIIAPHYNEMQLKHLSVMILLLCPSFLFNQVCQFLTSMLNAFNVFYVPEITGFFSSVLNITLIILLAPHLGIYSLAVGYYTGILILLLFLLLRLRKLNIHVISNPFKFRLNDIKPFIFFSIPFFLPAFLGQFNNVLEKSIATTLGIGAVSMIDYSRKFSENVVMVLASIFTTMLLPCLCNMFALKNNEGFLTEFKSMFQFSLLIMTFLVSMLTVCPASIINILYNKGSIGASELNKISNLCTLYCWAECAVLVFMLFGIALISAGKGKTYALYGSFAQVSLILCNIALVRFFGAYTFPLSLLISHASIAIVLYCKFPVKSRELHIITLKGALQIILCCALLFFINHELSWWSTHNPYYIIGINCSLIAAFTLAYAYIVKTEDRKLIEKLIGQVKLTRTAKNELV